MAITKNNIKLLETFVSIQGEGVHQGKICTFIRFKDCNLNCSFCDTQLRMKSTPEATYKISDIIQIGSANSNNNYVITGGEPTLQKYENDILHFIEKLEKKDTDNYCVEFETNGFRIDNLLRKITERFPLSIVDHIYVNYSPKNYLVKSASNKNYVEILSTFHNINSYIENSNICLKILCDNNNVTPSSKLIDFLIENNVPKKCIYVMPLGYTKEALSNVSNIYNLCVGMGVSFSSRLHIMHSMY